MELQANGALSLRKFTVKPLELSKEQIEKEYIYPMFYRGTLADGDTIEIYSAADRFYARDDNGKMFAASIV
jgi:hypothetical protein